MDRAQQQVSLCVCLDSKIARSQRLLNDEVLLPSLDRGDDGGTRNGSVLDGPLISGLCPRGKNGLVVSRRKYREDGSVLTQFDQTQFGRRVFWPVTTSCCH